MFKLIISLVALCIGALIYPLIRKRVLWLSFFDAFVFLSVVGLTLFHLIPHSLEVAGLPALLAAGLGFFVPALLHNLQPHDHGHDHEKRTHGHRRKWNFLLTFLLVGVVTHSVLDGITLSMGDVEHAATDQFVQKLGLGVLFHRLPEGIFLTFILMPRYGIKVTATVIAANALSTVAGYVLGHMALPHLGLTLLNLLQALIAGMLLHVVFHSINIKRSPQDCPRWNPAEGLGALSGIFALVLIDIIAPVDDHSHGADILIALKHAADTIAPLWLAAACLLFVLYRLASHPKQNLQETGRRLASILNPPPGSAAFDKRPRWLAATGIIAFLTVFDWRFNAFFALACACIILYACLEMRNLPTRTDTPPCTTHNTFTQWLATSWSQLIIFALALSALPSFLDPLKSFLITHDPSLTIAVFAGLSLLLLLALFYSQTHIPTIAIATAMALMMSLPAPPIPRTVIAMILGLGLCTVFRNGYHSRGAQALAANDATLRPAIRRIQILAPCLIIALATLPAWLTPGNKLSDMTTVHNLATPPEDTHLHDAEPGSHLPFSLPLALFATAGMVLIFRHGPRKLVTMALGKQPHTHG